MNEYKYDVNIITRPREESRQNEDSSRSDFDDNSMMVLADGISGAGNFADLLINQIMGKGEEELSPIADQIKEGTSLEIMLQNLVTESSEQIYKDNQFKDKGSTLELAFFNSSHAYFIHTGDSRTYIFLKDDEVEVTPPFIKKGNIVLTEDKNQTVAKIDVKTLNKGSDEEKEYYAWRKNRTSTLEDYIRKGMDNKQLDYARIPIEKIDTVIMMSDGAYENITFNELKDIVSRRLSSQETAEALLNIVSNPEGTKAFKIFENYEGLEAAKKEFSHKDDITISVVKPSLEQIVDKTTNYQIYDGQTKMSQLGIHLQALNEILEKIYPGEFIFPKLNLNKDIEDYWLFYATSMEEKKLIKPILKNNLVIGGVAKLKYKYILGKEERTIDVAVKFLCDQGDRYLRKIYRREVSINKAVNKNNNGNIADLIKGHTYKTNPKHESYHHYHIIINEWRGESLQDLLNKGVKFNIQQIHLILKQVANALTALKIKYLGEEFQVIHRDVEPRNIVIDGYEIINYKITGDLRATLVDFSLGKQLEGFDTGTGYASTGTQAANVRHTAYKAPEQRELIKRNLDDWGLTKQDFGKSFQEKLPGDINNVGNLVKILEPFSKFQQTDIYPLGILAYYLIIRELPFNEEINNYQGEKYKKRYVDSIKITLDKVLSSVKEMNNDDLDFFNEFIRRCIQPEPESRFADGNKALQYLNQWPGAVRIKAELKAFNIKYFQSPESQLYQCVDMIKKVANFLEVMKK